MRERATDTDLPADEPCALVTGATQVSYGMIRALGEAGVPVVTATAHLQPACFSRYVRHRLRLANSTPTTASRRAVRDFAAQRTAPTVLFAHSEQWVQAIARERGRFAETVRLPYGAEADLDLVLAKHRMHHLCIENDLPVPQTRTFNVNDDWEEFLAAAEALLPVVIKPDMKTPDAAGFAMDVRYFDDAAALRRWAARHYGAGGPIFGLVAQQYIAGPVTDIVAYHGYKAADGGVHMVGLTKLRTHPPHCGSMTTAARCAAPAEATQVAQRLLAVLPYAGLFDLEFKRDAGSGRWYFIELNPRCGLPSYAATAAGMNLPKLAFDAALGRPLPEPRTVTESSVGWSELHADLQSLRGAEAGMSWARALWRHRLTFRGCTRVVYAYANRRDSAVARQWLRQTLRRRFRAPGGARTAREKPPPIAASNPVKASKSAATR